MHTLFAMFYRLLFADDQVLSESTETASKKKTKSSEKKAKTVDDNVKTEEVSQPEQQCTACAEMTDYGPQISALETRLQTMTDNLDLPVINGYGTSIGDIQEGLTRLNTVEELGYISILNDPLHILWCFPFCTLWIVLLPQKLETFQNEQAADQRVSTLIKSVESLEKSLSELGSQIESVEQSKEGGTSTAVLKEEIVALQAQMDKELASHSAKVDALSKENANSKATARNTEGLESKMTALEKKVSRFEKAHKEMKIKIKAVEKLIAEQNQKIKAVHESTIGAMASRLSTQAMDWMSNLGERMALWMQNMVEKAQEIEWKKHFEYYTSKSVEIATEVGNTAVAKVQEVDWKGHLESAQRTVVFYGQKCMETVQSIDWEGHWNTMTDARTYESALQWLQGMWAFCDEWWMNGVQPTIARQAKDLWLQLDVMTREGLDFVHSHVIYQKMVTQLVPYMEMVCH